MKSKFVLLFVAASACGVLQAQTQVIWLYAGITGWNYNNMLEASYDPGCANPGWTVLAGVELPKGLDLAITGQLSGTPTVAGRYLFTAVAACPNVSRSNFSFGIDIVSSEVPPQAPLAFATRTLADAVRDRLYLEVIDALGGNAPYTCTLSPLADPLPTGLSLSPSCIIRGTPTGEVRTYGIAVDLKDARGLTHSENFRLVLQTTGPSVPVPSRLVLGRARVSYSDTLTPAPVAQDQRWRLVSGVLPDGLSLTDSNQGTISGTPQRRGVWSFVMQLTDQGSRQTFRRQTIVVGDCSLSDLTAQLFKDQRIPQSNLTATGCMAPVVWSQPSGTLPPGLTFQGNLLSGTPTQVGIFQFVIRATENLNAWSRKTASVGNDTFYWEKSYSVSVSLVTSAVIRRIVNHARSGDSELQATFAVGSIIRIEGAGFLGGATGCAGIGDPLGTRLTGPLLLTLSGVQVRLNNLVAPLYAVCGEQTLDYIIAQIPFEAPLGNTTVTVTAPAVVQPPTANIGVVAVQPGSYCATIRRATGLVTPSNATFPGDELRMITTGLGAVTPAATTGQPCAANQLVRAGLTAAVVGADGKTVTAPVTSASCLAGSAGLYELQFSLPAVPAGNARFAIGSGSPQPVSGNSCTIPVEEVVSDPQIGTLSPLRDCVAEYPCEFSFSGSGGSPPYSYTLTPVSAIPAGGLPAGAANVLPAGLQMDANGRVTGTSSATDRRIFFVRLTDRAGRTVDKVFDLQILPPIRLSIKGVPETVGPADPAPRVTVEMVGSYPVTLSGTLDLAFTPAVVNAPQGTAVFPNPVFVDTRGRQTPFTISGTSSPAYPLLAGNVAGEMRLSVATIRVPVRGGEDRVLPINVPSVTAIVPRLPNVITACYAARSGSGFTIRIEGSATSRDLVEAVYTFGAAPSQQLGTSSFTIALTSPAKTYFESGDSVSGGSAFLIQQTFSATQGDANQISSANVTLRNTVANGNVVSGNTATINSNCN